MMNNSIDAGIPTLKIFLMIDKSNLNVVGEVIFYNSDIIVDYYNDIFLFCKGFNKKIRNFYVLDVEQSVVIMVLYAG